MCIKLCMYIKKSFFPLTGMTNLLLLCHLQLLTHTECTPCLLDHCPAPGGKYKWNTGPVTQGDLSLQSVTEMSHNTTCDVCFFMHSMP